VLDPAGTFAFGIVAPVRNGGNPTVSGFIGNVSTVTRRSAANWSRDLFKESMVMGVTKFVSGFRWL
jgi:hypothetical protein